MINLEVLESKNDKSVVHLLNSLFLISLIGNLAAQRHTSYIVHNRQTKGLSVSCVIGSLCFGNSSRVGARQQLVQRLQDTTAAIAMRVRALQCSAVSERILLVKRYRCQ